MTLYTLLRSLCGLSQKEAAEFHGVGIRSIEHWGMTPSGNGRTHEPPAVRIAELRALYAHIEATAAAKIAEIRREKPETAELKFAQSDKDARKHGLPCVGAHTAMLAIVAARIDIPAKIR